MKASLSFYPNTKKKSKKTGKIPLYVRVCYKGLKAEERLNIQVVEDLLIKWDPMTMRFSDRTMLANKLLNTLDQRFEEYVFMNATILYSQSPRKILDYVMGKPENNQLIVIEFIDNYFSSSVQSSIELAAGTIRNYRKSINHLKRFLTVINKSNISFDELNNGFVADFMQYLNLLIH